MIDLYHKSLSSRTIIFTMSFLIEKQLSLTLCPTAVWSRNGITVAGMQSGTAGSDSSSLNFPIGVYFTDNDFIYVSDANNYRVQRFTPMSTIGKTIINSSSGVALNQFSYSNLK